MGEGQAAHTPRFRRATRNEDSYELQPHKVRTETGAISSDRQGSRDSDPLASDEMAFRSWHNNTNELNKKFWFDLQRSTGDLRKRSDVKHSRPPQLPLTLLQSLPLGK
jgi:hypothetical protein